MKRYLIPITLLLASCGTKNQEQVIVDTDTLAIDVLSNSKQSPVSITFPLDSLLKFDSEIQLKNVFGEHVQRSVGYYPEGMGEYANTLLFPETKNEVEFVWRDDTVSFSGLSAISVRGALTDWKTKEGITTGTTLRELEKLNEGPFTFWGFGWDYSGGVNWGNGKLSSRGIFVNLDYAGESIPPEFDGLLGDHQIKSDSTLAQKANPIVVEISMSRSDD